ncbi:RraA family protein [Candidatus Latescibacterota bacterium]
MKSKTFASVTCVFVIVSSLILSVHAHAQMVTFTKQDLIDFTPEWKGERFPDGRPKVPDGIIERMKNVELEEAWGVLRGEGYIHQFEGNWQHVHPGKTLVGRAVTVVYLPFRPIADKVLLEKGKKDGRIGHYNSWTIDTLVPGDVYVADFHGDPEGGPIMGGNLATAIMKNSRNGVLFDGEIRDLGQAETMEGFNSFVRGWNPTYSYNYMLLGINVPIRIGQVTVFPGDIILGKREGVIVIPPHLAERVVTTAELVNLRDRFGFQRIKEGTYTPGQIDQRWSDEMEKDFSQWLKDHMDELPVPKEQIQELLKKRTW